MATIKRRALPSPLLCARRQQTVPISSGQQCLSHTSCPDFPRRKNPTMDACLQPVFLISVVPPGHRLRRLWRTASSSLSEANLFISTKCCSRGSVLFFRASPRLLIGSENIKEAKLGMSWFILHVDLINFVAVTIGALCVNFGEVALSRSPPTLPPPTAALRNELEQLFLGLKPDGAAVLLKQKMSDIFSVHAKMPSNPVGTGTFLRYSDWAVISSVGSVCVAQDGRGSRLHVCSSQSDLAIAPDWQVELLHRPACAHMQDGQALLQRPLPPSCAVEARNFSPHGQRPGARPEHCVLFPRYSTRRSRLRADTIYFAARLKSRSAPAKKVNTFSSDILYFFWIM